MSWSAPRARVADLISDAVKLRTGVVLVGQPGSGRRSLLAGIDLGDGEWTRVRVPSVAGNGERALESLMLAGILTAPPPGVPPLTAAVHAVRALAKNGPVLLVLEDADRLDEASAQVISAAMSNADITVAATVRPPFPTAGALRILTDGHDSTVIPVPPLPFEEIHRLLSDMLGGDVDADAAGRIYNLSGGLPGVARSIAAEARRAGRLLLAGSRWAAARDLWTPSISLVADRLTDGLTAPEHDALWSLATLGPSDLTTARRVAPWPVLVSLDDRGLIRFVDSEGRTLVAIFPPVLEDHLRHQARTARGRAAAEHAAKALEHPDAAAAGPGPREPLGAPVRWSTPEAAAILGRLFREDAAVRAERAGQEWARNPTDQTALIYLQALLDDGASHERIEQVLAAERAPAPVDPSLETTRIRAWEATYRGFVAHDLPRALALLDTAKEEHPPGVAILDATAQHLRLLSAEGGVAALPDIPASPVLADSAGRAATLTPLDLPGLRAADVVRMVRGEILLARGRTEDAAKEFAAVTPLDPLHYDTDALIPLTLLCGGDIEEARERSSRQVDAARGTLDRSQLEPHAYVTALSLYLTGRLESLRTHLTGVFAVNAPAPLRPASRAGLLSIAASLSLRERNLASARSLVAQLAALRAGSGALPFTRHEPMTAALDIVRGRPAPEATRPAWERVDALLDDGDVVAAVFDGVRLIELHLDEERTARLARLAAASQGSILPVLGSFLDAALEHSPEHLVECADLLRGHGLAVMAASAHAMAIRLWQRGGHAERAIRETGRLHAAVRELGNEGRTLASWIERPGSMLTAREREIAQLVAGGASNREVADRLVVSERTVDNHIYRIFRKLGIGSRADLARVL